MYRLALLLLLAAPFRVSTLAAPRPQADHRHRPPPPSSASPPPPLSLAPRRPPVAPPRAAAASVQRREVLRRSGGVLAAAAAAAAGVAATPPSALAFDNAVAEYAKYADTLVFFFTACPVQSWRHPVGSRFFLPPAQCKHGVTQWAAGVEMLCVTARYADKPKRKGSPPKDVGLASRTVEVR